MSDMGLVQGALEGLRVPLARVAGAGDRVDVGTLGLDRLLGELWQGP